MARKINVTNLSFPFTAMIAGSQSLTGGGGSFMLKARILAITDSFNQTEQKRSVFSRGRRLDEACLPGYTLDPFQVLDELLQRVLKICDDIKDM